MIPLFNPYIRLICLLLLFSASKLFSQKSYFQKLVAQDRGRGEEFGRAISIYDNYIIIGCINKAVLGNYSVGAAYVFKKQVSGKWEQIQRLGPTKPKAYTCYGSDVNLNDTYVVVSASEDEKIITSGKGEISAGAVYVYKKDSIGKLVQTQKLFSPNKTKWKGYGLNVSISKQFIAVSAIEQRLNKWATGVVFIYKLDSSATWKLTDTITCNENYTGFARKMSMSDSNLIVSSHDSSEVSYIYSCNNNKKWQLKTKIGKKELAKISKITDKELDPSVCISDNYMAIGAPGDWDPSKDKFLIEARLNTDSVMEYIKEGKDGNVTFMRVPNIKRIRDSLNINPKEFKKRAKAIESDASRQKRMAAAGCVYIYKKNKLGNWIFHQLIQANDKSPEALFGGHISISDSIMIIGAVGEKRKVKPPFNPYFAGAAYIFKLNHLGKWVQTTKLVSEPRGHDKFSFSVDVYKKTIIVGARFETEDVIDGNKLIDKGGAVYVYEN